MDSIWRVKRIDEADFGCEERMPGEPLLVLVTIENEYGEILQLEVAEEWLDNQEIEEGDEWPLDMKITEEKAENINKQSVWMENYFEALQELDAEDNR